MSFVETIPAANPVVVSADERARRFGNRAGLILVVGGDDVSRQGYARALERALFCHGRNVFYLAEDAGGGGWSDAIDVLMRTGTLVISSAGLLGADDLRRLRRHVPRLATIVIDGEPTIHGGDVLHVADLRAPGSPVLRAVYDLLERKGMTLAAYRP